MKSFYVLKSIFWSRASFRLSFIVAVLFMAATLALVVGLAFFLREVHEASQSIRIFIHGK